MHLFFKNNVELKSTTKKEVIIMKEKMNKAIAANSETSIMEKTIREQDLKSGNLEENKATIFSGNTEPSKQAANYQGVKVGDIYVNTQEKLSYIAVNVSETEVSWRAGAVIDDIAQSNYLTYSSNRIEQITDDLENGISLMDFDAAILGEWTRNNINSSAQLVEKNTTILSEFIRTKNIEQLYIKPAEGFKYRILFFSQKALYTVLASDSDLSSWNLESKVYNIPVNAEYFRIILAKDSEAEILPDESVNISIKRKGVSNFLNPYNYYNELEWIDGEYFHEGVLIENENVMSTKPIKLYPGVKFRLSSFYPNGVLISYWKNGEHVVDVQASENAGVDYLIIPDNADSVSFTIRKEDEDKYVYISGNPKIDDTLAILTLIRQNKAKEGGRLTGKVLSILGDSISTFGGECKETEEISENGEKIINYWSDGKWTYKGNRVKYPVKGELENVEDTYWMKLIQKYHMKLGVNDSWAGSRVTWDGVTTNTHVGEDIHSASKTRIKHLGENGEPDFILVFMGSNDIYKNVSIGTFNTSDPRNLEKNPELLVKTFADAYRTMIIRLQKAYKKAKIVAILPYYAVPYMWSAEGLDKYNKVIKEVCDYFGVEVIDARKCGITMQNNSAYLIDEAHPNIKGMELLFEEISKLFKEYD